ncbi:MAG: hypothetical protein M3235_16685 [Actinomycetota bacterium]|nr:hypothetical protein [Actinomycetota bacterium]
MNIGRTIRVFRAEPVVSPLPPAPRVESDEHPAGTAAEPVRTDVAPTPVPARLGR